MPECAINNKLRQIHLNKRKLRPYLFYKKFRFDCLYIVIMGGVTQLVQTLPTRKLLNNEHNPTRKQRGMSMYRASVYRTRESWARHFMIDCGAVGFS